MFLFDTKPNGYLLKERSYVATGPFNLSITPTCLILIGIISFLYGCIWLTESPVLLSLFGFDMPTFIKMSSTVSTLMLYTIVFKSVGMIYMLVVSCFFYIIFHTIILAALIEVYRSNMQHSSSLYALIYYEENYTKFYWFMCLCMVRLIITLPLMYYILVLANIRLNGGTGWEKKTAFELERKLILERMDDMKLRKKYMDEVEMLKEMPKEK